MSEEKLYAVKNDEGEWLNQYCFWGPETWATPDKDDREKVAKHYGGHVVAFVEEPKKVVLSKEQAEIVKNASDAEYPATYISDHSYADEERLIINAYVNGYTVAKEKKYLVFKELGGKQKNQQAAQAYRSFVFPNTITWSIEERKSLSTSPSARFTESEIEKYGLQDCEKEEVTDDD